MKLSFRLIPVLAIAITLVTFIVARNQVRSEKRALRADLERRAQILTESLQETVEPIVQSGATGRLRRVVERFGNREHLVGVAVYDADGKELAMSPKLDAALKAPPGVFARSIEQDGVAESYETIGELMMYVYAVPLHSDSEIAGILILLHDASYIEAQSSRIWRETLWHVVIQILLIVLITFFAIRWTIDGPITRVAEWMKDLRNGKVAPFPYRMTEGFLGPLSKEAATLAQKLAEARAAAKEEAQLREESDSLWTATRLRANIQKRLEGRSLFVISNREPYEHVYGNNGIEVRVPASGLVTALEPILCACDGTWIAHGSANADRRMVDAKDRVRVPPDQPHYTLRRVWLTKEDEEGYYLGFANEGIWPLCHIAHTRPVFRSEERLVGKECRSLWSRYQSKQNANVAK